MDDKGELRVRSAVSKKFLPKHSALKLEKKCNFKSTKTHYLHFQKWQKKKSIFAPEKSL